VEGACCLLFGGTIDPHRARLFSLCAATQDILTEALWGALILVILERFYLTRSVYWLEEHLDYTCVESIIFGQAALSFTAQIRVFWQNTRRLA
jgi:hypothetical protein